MNRISCVHVVVAGALAALSVRAATGEVPPPPPSIKDDPACTLFHWPMSAAEASAILKATETFADTGIYYAGEPPPQMAAFNLLLDQADAASWFEDVARNGGPVGRLYALCAFQLLDKRRARSLAGELRASDARVFTQFGCIGAHESVNELIDVINKYSYGKDFRKARARTYEYFGKAENICARSKR